MKEKMVVTFGNTEGLLRALFPVAMERRDHGLCPTCGKTIEGFRDALSQKEFGISGMCQRCQDGVFGVTLSCKCGKTKPGTPGTLETTYVCGFCKRLE